jgi:endonuclease/exonuclease/phosphatase (EEP) superfamily protein YafD
VRSNLWNGWPRLVAFVATAIAVVGLAASCVLPLVPTWPCVLLEHFRVQYVAVGIVVVAGAAALRMRGYFDLAAIATLVNLVWIAPDLCGSSGEIPDGGVPVRVLVLNVHTESSSFDEVARLIDDVKPDIVGLVEVDERWLRGVAPAVAQFAGRGPPQHRSRRHGCVATGPTAVYHRGQVGQPRVATAALTRSAATRSTATRLVHPRSRSAPPHSPRVEALEAVADRARAMPSQVVIMGDFNATPWSRPFRRLVVRWAVRQPVGLRRQASFPAGSLHAFRSIICSRRARSAGGIGGSSETSDPSRRCRRPRAPARLLH